MRQRLTKSVNTVRSLMGTGRSNESRVTNTDSVFPLSISKWNTSIASELKIPLKYRQ